LHFAFRCSSLSYVLSIEHTTGLPIRTYIALYPICPLPYLRTAYTPIPARDTKALIHSIAVIHSCLPLIFLNAVVSPLFISTFEGKVVPRAKLVSSTLRIASEG
jgi:hypothetical protein